MTEEQKKKNKEYRREWDKKNREKRREYCRKSNEKSRNSPDKIKKINLRRQELRLKNRDKVNETNNKWYENKKEKRDKYIREWRINNRERINERLKKSYYKLKNESPIYMLSRNIRSSISKCISRNGYDKTSKTMASWSKLCLNAHHLRLSMDTTSCNAPPESPTRKIVSPARNPKDCATELICGLAKIGLDSYCPMQKLAQ